MLDINPINQNNFNSNNAESQSRPNVNIDAKPEIKNKPNSITSTNPDELFTSKEDNQKIIFYFSLIILLFVGALCGYLYYAKTVKNEELKTKERMQADLEAKLNTPELVKIDNLASGYSLGLTQLSKLIIAPTQYSKLFNKLQMMIPNDVNLDSFSVDEKNKIKIVGKTESLESAAKFIKAFETSNYFENIVLDSNQQSKDKSNKTIYAVSLSGTLNVTMLSGEEK